MRRLLVPTVLVLARSASAQPVPEVPSEPIVDEGAAVPNPLRIVRFDTGSAEITDAFEDDLDDVAAWMDEHPLRLVYLEGYTDRSGSADNNLRLSQRRTDSVRDALVARGADASRILAIAHGEREPGSGRQVVVRGSTQTYAELIRSQHRLDVPPEQDARRAPSIDELPDMEGPSTGAEENLAPDDEDRRREEAGGAEPRREPPGVSLQVVPPVVEPGGRAYGSIDEGPEIMKGSEEITRGSEITSGGAGTAGEGR